MKPLPLDTHLSRVAAAPLTRTPTHSPTLVSSDRKRFWRAFVEWLATATDDETEQMDRVLAEHAPHMRTLIDAVSDALRRRDSAARLPTTLLATLVAHDWKPRHAQAIAHAA